MHNDVYQLTDYIKQRGSEEGGEGRIIANTIIAQKNRIRHVLK